MKKIYKPGFADQRIELLKIEQENGIGGEESVVSWKEIFCGERFSRATMVGIILAVLQQLTGINVIIFYSNTIFEEGTDLAPELITFLVGAVNFLSTLGGMALLTKFGRRSIALVCQFLMAVVLILLGWCAQVKYSTAEIVFVLVFIVLFEFSVGTILWLYMAEIL
jgi:predicted MFS family arabinose efflux permease